MAANFRTIQVQHRSDRHPAYRRWDVPNLLLTTLAVAQAPLVAVDLPNPPRARQAQQVAVSGRNEALYATLPAAPFVAHDWPNPQRRAWYDVAGIFVRNPALDEPVATPAPRIPVELPNPARRRWYDAPAWAPNPALLESPPVVAVPFALFDWPNPRRAEPRQQVDWVDSWVARFGLVVPAGPQPFSQSDWPNPRGASRLHESYQAWNILFPPSPPAPITVAGQVVAVHGEAVGVRAVYGEAVGVRAVYGEAVGVRAVRGSEDV